MSQLRFAKDISVLGMAVDLFNQCRHEPGPEKSTWPETLRRRFYESVNNIRSADKRWNQAAKLKISIDNRRPSE